MTYTTWDQLNADLYKKKLSSPQVFKLLQAEVAGPARKMFALRLFSRFNRLRFLEDKAKLMLQLKARGSLDRSRGRPRG